MRQISTAIFAGVVVLASVRGDVGAASSIRYITGAEAARSVAPLNRVEAVGKITEYKIPQPGGGPWLIALGPDGALWFTEVTGSIGRISTSGVIAQYKIPSNTMPLRDNRGLRRSDLVYH
jgi:streptogramin lyase